MHKITRRSFVKQSTLAGAALSGLGANSLTAAEGSPVSSDRQGNAATLPPRLFLNGKVSLSRPLVSASQVGFRLGLARTRTASYPLDSMDFIMMDLERPDGCSRHAHWCTGDLTGRLLEFLSCAEGVDGKFDPRLRPLFERILLQRRSSGIFGRYAGAPKNGVPEADPLSGANRLFCGLIRYYELTRDARALDSAEGVAQYLLSRKDTWQERVKASKGKFIEAWVTEPFARLYGLTQQSKYLEFCGLINEHLGTCLEGAHAHGFMSTLRGLQVAALLTGDVSWNRKPEQNRRLIIDHRLEMPDGGISEGFPRSARNEGCAIADWLMLNLNAGLISGQDEAYERAERIFWNALAFNQWISGAFGHRGLTSNGYTTALLEEAWWCCVHDAGMAMGELARHAVTFRDGAIRVNLLVAGDYALALPGGQNAKVKIATEYPAAAAALIETEGAPANMPVKVRVPACVRGGELSETKEGNQRRIRLKGRLGHRIEECHPGVMLTYGPLVLAPSIYNWAPVGPSGDDAKSVPAGYIPETLPADSPVLKVSAKADADGFLELRDTPLPEWSYFEEGPGARCWIPGSTAIVPVKFKDGTVKELRFSPLCYNTSNLTLCPTPIVFKGIES